jgi:hypothetical protein
MCHLFNYANACSLPRCLYIRGDRLFQVWLLGGRLAAAS